MYQDSVIEKIRFSYNAKVEIYNGQLIELTVNSHKVLYQVVQGITKNEQLSNKNESSFIIGEAIQLGEWNDSAGRFEGTLKINMVRKIQESDLEYHFFKVLQRQGLDVLVDSNSPD